MKKEIFSLIVWGIIILISSFFVYIIVNINNNIIKTPMIENMVKLSIFLLLTIMGILIHDITNNH